MTEIDIERKPTRAGLGWLLTFFLLVIAAGAAWYFTTGPGAGFAGADTDSLTVLPSPRVSPPPERPATSSGAQAPGATTPAPTAP